MKFTKKFSRIVVIIMVLSGVLVSCTLAETAITETTELSPGVTEASTITPETIATAVQETQSETEELALSDPATWELSDSVKQVDEYGYTSYILEDWQVNFVLTTVIESFNTIYFEADHIVTPKEVEQYFDTESPAWVGDGASNVGFLGQYEDNVAKGLFIRVSYPISEGYDQYYTNWKAWAVEPPEDFVDTAGYTRFDKLTVVVQFRMEEAPLYMVNEANEVEFENTYWGPMIFTNYLQYSDGQWKIVENIASDLGTYDPTPTPGQN
jgi:hypothetical protein